MRRLPRKQAQSCKDSQDHRGPISWSGGHIYSISEMSSWHSSPAGGLELRLPQFPRSWQCVWVAVKCGGAAFFSGLRISNQSARRPRWIPCGYPRGFHSILRGWIPSRRAKLALSAFSGQAAFSELVARKSGNLEIRLFFSVPCRRRRKRLLNVKYRCHGSLAAQCSPISHHVSSRRNKRYHHYPGGIP